MILSRVFYELFDWEASWLDHHPEPDFVELDRQLRLEMADGSDVYIAWNWWSPSGDCYFVDIGEKSFCREQAAIVRDVSASSFWYPLIGKAVELAYLDAEKQVLRIISEDEAVYCCSFHDGIWGQDVLTIGRQMPKASPP